MLFENVPSKTLNEIWLIIFFSHGGGFSEVKFWEHLHMKDMSKKNKTLDLFTLHSFTSFLQENYGFWYGYKILLDYWVLVEEPSPRLQVKILLQDVPEQKHGDFWGGTVVWHRPYSFSLKGSLQCWDLQSCKVPDISPLCIHVAEHLCMNKEKLNEPVLMYRS